MHIKIYKNDFKKKIYIDLFPVHPCCPHFQTKKLFQSSFLYTLLKISQLKTIWFEAENWPEHFTLEAENPFTCTLHCIFTFFMFFYVLSFSLANNPLEWFV